MLRRPPTSIELTVNDLLEYETMRKEQEALKEQGRQSKPYNEPPAWQPGPKHKQEVYSRIGYIPPSPDY